MSNVIECSVDETNRLRAQLGLAPLRVSRPNGTEECLELSVAATNALRQRLGLGPLKTTAPLDQPPRAVETVEPTIPQKEEEKQVLSFVTTSLGEDVVTPGGAQSWAARMRHRPTAAAVPTTAPVDPRVYSATDLQGLHVGHAVHELPDEDIILTLADAPLLQTDALVPHKVRGLNDDAVVALENVQLAQAQQRQEGLREKRSVELGLVGAALDDDEFVELGGTQGPSRAARAIGGAKAEDHPPPRRGFQIGAHLEEEPDDVRPSEMGRFGNTKHAISLLPAVADVTASDFMTVEEYEQERGRRVKKEKKPKKEKKEKKKNKRRRHIESDDEEEETDPTPVTAAAGNLLEELQATAVVVGSKRLKRRATEESFTAATDPAMTVETVQQKRARYDQAMTKGHERSQQVFAPPKVVAPVDEAPDDAFLHAALEKARRVQRLQSLPRGAASVAAALQHAPPTVVPSSEGGGTVPFRIDATQEFTRALLARAEQTERALARRQKRDDPSLPAVATPKVTMKEEEAGDIPDETVNLQELSKQVTEEEDRSGLDGTGHTVPMGRGVGAMLQLLQHSGEMQRKHAGQEEMRGRAKDERTYDDYAPLDLSSVVRIDERNATNKDKELAHREVKLEYRDEHGRLLTRKEAFRELSYQFHGYGSGKRKQEKKLEQIAREQAEARMASRQVGEGASAGIFGALKEAQKATGKAFVVHKTGL